MIRLFLGIIMGGLVMAFFPEAGREVRKATNEVAVKVEQVTSEDETWQKLEEDTISLLQEKVDELRK